MLRYNAIMGLLRLSGSRVPEYFDEMKKFSRMSRAEIKAVQRERLEKLLVYAWENVPYYRTILESCAVVSDGKVNLDRFASIPVLTKDIIRAQGEAMYSTECGDRGCFVNTSGGSTGEPVKLLQDREYSWRNDASKLFFNHMLGKEPGDSEFKFWGSYRDLYTGPKEITRDWLYNRKLVDSFTLDDAKLRKTVRQFNSFKPKAVWAYVDSMVELAKFVRANNIKIHSPAVIITTTGVLHDEQRELLEKTFSAPVCDQYGSRETGAIACQCRERKALHVFDWNCYVEVADSRILITLLTNYSMPLIRYEIGDTAELETGECSCGLHTSLIKKITGRIFDHFVRADGSLVHGQYFTALMFNRAWLKRFKILQKEDGNITVYLVCPATPPAGDLAFIERSVKEKMGSGCEVKLEFVGEIPPTPSGKYRYTESLVKRK